jgi:tRNA(fMet)-specific endonuclease VapC
MIYLLDTDILIVAMRGLKSAKPLERKRAEGIVHRCQQAMAKGDRVVISAITVSELEYGACRSGQYSAEIAAVHKILAPFEVLDYHALDCPPRYGGIRHDLEVRGVTIGGMDLLIAAQGVALGATVVTNSVSHFSRVTGLQVVNWSAIR